MFKIYFQKSSAFSIRISVSLLCLALSNSALKTDFKNNLTQRYDPNSNLLKYNRNEPWGLAPVGKSAYEVLKLFFMFSTTSAVKTALMAGTTGTSHFWKSVIGYTFIQQVPMTITVSFGLLGVCLLFLMPCFIALYRNRQIAASEETEVDSAVISPKTGWLIYEFLAVFCAVAVFGGVLMSISVTEFDDHFEEFFAFAKEAIHFSYSLKSVILYNFYHSLYDVSRSSFETIQLIYDINDEIVTEFMSEANYRMKQVRYLARSIQWDVIGVQKRLVENKKKLESLTINAGGTINNMTDKYKDALNELKQVFDAQKADNIFGPVLDPLLSSPSYTASNSTLESHNKSIDKLEEVLKLDFQGRVKNITRYVENAVKEPNYDPTDIISKLSDITFNTEIKIRDSVRVYVTYLEVNFTEGDRATALNAIEEIRLSAMEISNVIYIIVFTFGMLSIALTVFYFVVYSLGILGTNGFRLRPSGVSVHKSTLSHGSGKILIIFLYVGVIFLALFWAVSLLVFVLSAVPIELCITAKAKSLFDISIDHATFRDGKHWFGMYSSPKFNSSVRKGLELCQNDASYFPTLLDPIVDEAAFRDLKAGVDTYSVKDTIDKAISDIPHSNISDSELSTLNLDGVLDLDSHSFFAEVLDFAQTLVDTNASIVFGEIADHGKSSAALRYVADAAAEAYTNLTIFLSKTAFAEDDFNTTLRSLNISIRMVMLQIDHLVLSYEAIVDFIQTSASDTYMKRLNETIIHMIDGIHYNLNITTQYFRQSISYCPALLVYYEKFLRVLCEDLVYPVAACWMGSLFVDILLVFAVFLILYSVPLFLMPPKSNSSDLPPAFVRPDDLPSSADRSIYLTSSKNDEESAPEKDGVASTSKAAAVVVATKKSGKLDHDSGSDSTPEESSPVTDYDKLDDDSTSETTPNESGLIAATEDKEELDNDSDSESTPKETGLIAATEKTGESEDESDKGVASVSGDETETEPVVQESSNVSASSENEVTDRDRTDSDTNSSEDKPPKKSPKKRTSSIKDML